MSEQNEKPKVMKKARPVILKPEPQEAPQPRYMAAQVSIYLNDVRNRISAASDVNNAWRMYSILDITSNRLDFTNDLLENSVRVLEGIEDNLKTFQELTSHLAKSDPEPIAFGIDDLSLVGCDVDVILSVFTKVNDALSNGFGYLYPDNQLESNDDTLKALADSRMRLGNTLLRIMNQVSCAGFFLAETEQQLAFELNARIIDRPEGSRIKELMQIFDTLLAVHSVTTEINKAIA